MTRWATRFLIRIHKVPMPSDKAILNALRNSAGNKTRAANILGMSRTSLSRILKRLVDDGHKIPAIGKADTGEALRQVTRERDILQDEVAQLTQSRDRALIAKPKIFKPVSLDTSKSRLRVVVPDMHGAHADRPAVAAMLADITRIKPTEIVILGDLIDCGGFLAAHHTIGYVPEIDISYEEDIKATNQFLDELQKAAPSATVHYIEGNHEWRAERWVITQKLMGKRDAEFLRRQVAPEYLLRLKERGIQYYRRSEHYQGIATKGTIKLGHCYFTHEIQGRTPQEMARHFGANVVYGHIHRQVGAIIRTVDGGAIGAWCPGTLSELQPYYAHTRVTDWSHGYAVQVINGDKREDFLHIAVPIIEGRSLLGGLLK